MEGARNRAIDLIEQGKEADYYIGTEGGIHSELGKTFLFSVVAIISKIGTIEYGTSTWAPLSSKLHQKIKLGQDLADAFKEEHFSIPKGSVSGALTMGKFSREKQFIDAFDNAINPFCNSEYY